MISAVWASPQSGKTSLACEIAVTLSQMENTVCLISASDYADLPLRFGLTIPPEKSITVALQQENQIRNCIVEASGNLFLLAPSPSDSPLGLVCTGSQAKALLKTANDNFDDVILDCTSWTANALSGEGIALCTHLYYPIPGKTAALMWHKANTVFLQKKRTALHPVVVSTEETYDYEALIRSMENMPETELILPYIQKYPEMENEGKLIMGGYGNSRSVRAYRKALSQYIEGIYFEAAPEKNGRS